MNSFFIKPISDLNIVYKVMKNDNDSIISINNYSKDMCSICTFKI